MTTKKLLLFTPSTMVNKIELGNTVSFLNEIGKGKVVKLLNNQQVLILREDGFEDVYRIAELIVVSKETHSEASFKHIPKNHKEETSVKKISKRHKKNNGIVWEIDLHIERLVENHRNLSNYEIVQIQIRHCEFTIEKAIKNNVSRLVVIHGKGEGVLKEEVRQLLKKYKVEAKDADYRNYGFGATEVRFF